MNNFFNLTFFWILRKYSFIHIKPKMCTMQMFLYIFSCYYFYGHNKHPEIADAILLLRKRDLTVGQILN